MSITPGGLSDVDALRPLWTGMHRHHADVMPELSPYVDDDESWAVRSGLYRALLAKPTTVLLLAKKGGSVIGYGLAHVVDRSETWLADTWATGGLIGEIESLAVAPVQRGRGIGTLLLDRLESELAAAGACDMVLGVLHGNADAIRLYRRRGFQPTWTYLSRLHGRS